MSNAEEKHPGARRKFRLLRYLLITAGVLAVLVVGAWVFLQQYVQIETYRPMLEAKIEESTGLPAKIGELDLALRPLPLIVAEGIAIGQDDFRLEAEHAEIWPDLRELLTREIRITRLDLTKLYAVVPSDPALLRERLQEVVRRMSQPKGGKIRFNVDRIQANRATLYLDAPEKPLFTGDLDFRNVLSPNPSVQVDAAVVALRDEVKAEGNVQVERGPRGKGIQSFKGSFSVDGLHLAKVVENAQTPRVVIDVDGRFAGTDPQSLSVGFSGDVAPTVGARSLGKSMEGPFTAKGTWDGSALRIEDINWEAAGLRVSASEVMRTEQGTLRVSVPEAVIGPRTLEPLLARASGKTLQIEPGPEAIVNVAGLEAVFTPKKSMRFEKGRVTLADIHVLDAEGKALFQDVQGVAVFEGDSIHIESLKGGGVNVAGTVTPDFKARKAAIDLTGALALSRAALSPFVSVESIKDISGTVDLGRVAGTFGGGKGLPDDFILKGETDDARVVLATKQVTDVFAPIVATFSTEGTAVEMTAKATSEKMGPIEAKGRYGIAERTWDGTLAFDPKQVVSPFLTKESSRKVVPALLEPYGPSTFDFYAALPAGKRKNIALRLTRQGEPALNAEAEMVKTRDGYRLGPLEGTATLPLANSAAYLPASVRAEGIAGLEFERSLDDETFHADIDLAEAAIASGAFVQKRSGVPATVGIEGLASQERWAAQTLTANVAGETVKGSWQENRLVFPDINVDAARLSVLLREGTSATGTITGSVATNPTQAELVLHDVALTYKPGVTVESLNGRVVYSQDRLALDDLAVSGANSAATVTMLREGSIWRGTVNAKQIDIEKVTDLWKAARSEPEEAPAQTAQAASAEGGGFYGRIDLQADRLLYRRGDIPDVRASFIGEGNRISIPGIEIRPGEGKGAATGEAVLARENSGAPWVVQGKANLDGFSASVLDGLVFQEPRGLKGQLDGEATFVIPIIANTPPINGASGNIELVGKDGTFGKMGIATKVLNVMRTTEIFRLRLPSLSDQGLTYDTAEFKGKITEGVLRIEDFSLERPSFAMSAEGVVNFPADDMRVQIQISPFETVTGLAEKIPIIGQAVNELKKLTPIGIVAKGSPYDPTVAPGSVAGGRAIEASAEQAPKEAQAESEEEPEPAASTETAEGEPQAGEPGVDQPAEEVAEAEAEAPEEERKGLVESVTGAPRKAIRNILGRD